MGYEIKERSVGEILDAAFHLYRNHFRVFVAAAFCVAVPVALLGSFVDWAIAGDAQALEALPHAGADDLASKARALLASSISFTVRRVGHVLEDGAMTLIVSDAYLGQPLSVASGYRRSFAALWPLLGTWALATLGMALGLMCLIVPGVLVILCWAFNTPAVVIEGRGARASLARSRELTTGNYGRLFLLYLVSGGVSWGIGLGLRSLIPDAVLAIPVLEKLVRLVPQILLAPIGVAAITLAYFDVRVRKEGFDLERLVLGLGQPESAVLRP